MAFAISLVVFGALIGWYVVREVKAGLELGRTQSRPQTHAAGDWQEEYYHDPFDGHDTPGAHGRNIRG